MARKRGFFAELSHQAAVAENNRQRSEVAAAKDQARRQREVERLHQQLERAVRRESILSEKEQKQLHIEAQEAEVERLNGELTLQLLEIDDVLSATLDVDDFVDLERLRKTVEVPVFQSPFGEPLQLSPPIQVPPQPTYVEPAAPRGVGAVLGGKKRHAEAVAAAQREFDLKHQQWQWAAAAVPMQQLAQLTEHKKAEDVRLQSLVADRARYDDEVTRRGREVNEANAELDEFIRDLQAGRPEAVEEYLGIVFSNSVYPAEWPWPPAYDYDPSTKELSIRLEFPAPAQLPTTRPYKYIRAKDEISSAEQSQKEQKDRYSSLLAGMTLRTLHEVWEADRGHTVSTISLVGSVAHVDLATGTDTVTPLVAVAAEREEFVAIDLRRVAPIETLRHLGAVISKNPLQLAAISLAPGVRGR